MHIPCGMQLQFRWYIPNEQLIQTFLFFDFLLKDTEYEIQHSRGYREKM